MLGYSRILDNFLWNHLRFPTIVILFDLAKFSIKAILLKLNVKNMKTGKPKYYALLTVFKNKFKTT